MNPRRFLSGITALTLIGALTFGASVTAFADPFPYQSAKERQKQDEKRWKEQRKLEDKQWKSKRKLEEEQWKAHRKTEEEWWKEQKKREEFHCIIAGRLRPPPGASIIPWCIRKSASTGLRPSWPACACARWPGSCPGAQR